MNPINQNMFYLGLIFVNFFPPIIFPNIYPPISVEIHIIKKIKLKILYLKLINLIKNIQIIIEKYSQI